MGIKEIELRGRLFDMVNKYPNDLQLGREVRILIQEWKSQTLAVDGDNDSSGYGDGEDDGDNHYVIKPDDLYNDDDYDY